MPDPPPAYPRVVLVDRCVLFIDDDTADSVLLPSRSSTRAQEQQRAIEAAASVRNKASRPSAVRKEPVTFRCECEDTAYYREVLDGIDLRLPDHLAPAPAPAVNYLTIGISLPPYHHLRSYPRSAHIASCHDGLLLLHFGTRRPGLPSRPWFYLVFDTRANSVAVVPPLPARSVTTRSHCDIGAGVAVQRRHKCHHYILAELYLRRDSQTRLASNKATLFIWSSPGFGPLHGWWVQKEVALPLPADEHHRPPPPTYSFRAHMVFAVSTTSLCWVDLRRGILLCDGISNLVGGGGGSTDVEFKFRFIPLPEECAIRLAGSLSPLSQVVEEYRSMSCMNCDTIEFVCMDDGYNHSSSPTIEATLTTWTLKLHLTDDWRWEKRTPAICIIRDDLLNDLPFMKGDRKLLRFTLSCPVISITPGVTYLSVAASRYKPEQEQLEAVGFYELCLDTLRQRVLSVFEFPSGSRIVPHSKTWICDRSQQWREIMELRIEEEETKELRFEEEESKGSLSKMAECDSDVLSPALESLRLRPTETTGVSPCSSKKPMGLQCAPRASGLNSTVWPAMKKGEISEGSGLSSMLIGKSRESNEGGATTMSKPRQHLYIILDDWELGYSIRKVDLEFDQLIPVGGGIAREAASSLPSPWIHFKASHERRLRFSDAIGSKILALHPKEEGSCDRGGFCFDIHEGSLISYIPRHADQSRARPIYFPIGNRLLALVGFSMELLDLQPLISSTSSQLDDACWSWRKLPDPPFDSMFVMSHAVLPDGQTIFVSVYGNLKTTYIFHMADDDGGSFFKWEKHGEWLLPFVGCGHFDSKLNTWVGIASFEEKSGHICSCELASATPGRRRPDVKYSKECLYNEDPAEKEGATLVYMGRESRYCLVECIRYCYKYNFEQKKADPHVSWMFRLTTFCLKLDENGDLTTGGSQRVRYYKAPRNKVHDSFVFCPQVFWL